MMLKNQNDKKQSVVFYTDQNTDSGFEMWLSTKWSQGSSEKWLIPQLGQWEWAWTILYQKLGKCPKNDQAMSKGHVS